MVLYSLPVYLFALLIIHMVFAPKAPVRRLAQIDSPHAHRMARRLRVLALLSYLGYLLFSTLFAEHLPEAAYLLTRGLYAALLFMNLIWALWLFARIRRQDELRWLGLLTALVLVTSLGAEWLGYRNLAQAIVLVIAGSLLALGLLTLLTRLMHEFYDALEQGTGPCRLRQRHAKGERDIGSDRRRTSQCHHRRQLPGTQSNVSRLWRQRAQLRAALLRSTPHSVPPA